MLAKTLEAILSGGHVERFHTVPTHLRETVGHHSYVVAWLTVLLSPPDTGPRVELLLAALQHDVPEFITGDIPAPFKRANPAVKAECDEQEQRILNEHHMPDFGAALTDEERRILKLADSLSGMAFCLHERKLGNHHIATSFNNFARYAASLLTEDTRDIFDILIREWNSYEFG